MFGKKALKEALESYQATMTQLQEQAQKQLAGINAVADAGERYEQLAAFEIDVSKKTEEALEKFSAQARKPTFRLVLTGWLIAAACFFTMVATASIIAPLGLMVGAGFGGICLGCAGFFVGIYRDGKVDSAEKGVPDTLDTLVKESRLCREQVLSKELKGVAASERFDALYERSEVKAAFAKAVARQKVSGDYSVSKLDKKKLEP